jgi:hypothetical protein
MTRGKLTGHGPRELLGLEDVAKFQNIVNEVRERAVCLAAKVMNAKSNVADETPRRG